MRLLSLLPALLVLSCSPSLKTPEDLVRAMKERYAETFPKTMTFTQKTIHTKQDGTKQEETWYESIQVPGRLSIRFDPVQAGNGILFVQDSVYSFESGLARVARPMVHPLMLLGFDVYALPVEETMKKLEKLRYDLSVMDEGVWQDRPAWIVGARAGDDSTRQFWVDKERLVLVRTLEPQMRMMMEVRFDDFMMVEGGWVGAEVLFLRDGKLVTEEYYSDVTANAEIDAREFSAAEWMYVRDDSP